MALPAPAQSPEDCRKVTDPALRLECYDKVPAAKPKPAAKPPPAPVAAGQGAWTLQKQKDTMTDRTVCVVTPKGKPFIQVNPASLYVSYRGRGGVNGFEYRIDDRPLSGMQLPSEIEKQIGAISIKGAVFQDVIKAKRLRIQTVTLIAGIITEDIDLTGLAPLYAQMQAECQTR